MTERAEPGRRPRFRHEATIERARAEMADLGRWEDAQRCIRRHGDTRMWRIMRNGYGDELYEIRRGSLVLGPYSSRRAAMAAYTREAGLRLVVRA